MYSGRITQQMTSARVISNVQTNLSSLSDLAQQVSTGKRINKPSDDPAGTASAMRLRTSLADQSQYSSAASDGLSWLSAADTALSSASDELLTAYTSGLNAANGTMSTAAREALAQQVEGSRANLLSVANTTYLDRPIFGGITSGSKAYDSAGAYVGHEGDVTRTVGDGVSVKVNVDAADTFGTTTGSTVFDKLTTLAAAIRSGDSTQISTATQAVSDARTQIVQARSAAGTAYNSVKAAATRADDATVTMKKALSSVEDVDTAEAYTNLQLQQVTYKAALSATNNVLSMSLVDFLR